MKTEQIHCQAEYQYICNKTGGRGILVRLTFSQANHLLAFEMDLNDYFNKLLERLEASDIQNNGKDRNGFFEPTRDMLFQRLSLLRDLHGKANAKPMLKSAWEYVVAHVPPEWLVLTEAQKAAIRKMLEED